MSKAAESLKRTRTNHEPEHESPGWKTLSKQAQMACPREEAG